jgi:CHRD domain-containing protein
MKWLVVLLIASASLLASCQESSWVVGVNNTSSGNIFLNATAASDDVTMYGASLTGDQENPPTGSDATGIARFHVMHDGSIRWSLRTTGLDSVIAAHIHAGIPGQNGPVIVPLFSGGPVNDINVRGEITDSVEVAAVLALFQADSAYVNVHTTAFQGGEIRGQVNPKETGGGGNQP